MSYYPSNLGYIGISSQSAQKTTAKTTSKIFIPFLSEEIGSEYDEEILSQGGDGKYTVASVKTQYREKVGFSCYAKPEVSGYLYSALLGKDTPSHLTTSPFYHTITVKTTDLASTPQQPWLTVEKSMLETSGAVRRIRAVKLSAITLEAEAGQPVKMSVEGTGLSGEIVTTKQTDTYETDNPFSFYHGTFHVNEASTTNFDIKSFSVKLTTENDESIQTVDLIRADIINMKISAEVTLGLNFIDYDLWKKANYGNSSSPSESYSDGSLEVILKTSSGVNEKRLQLTIPKVRLAPHDINMAPEGSILEQPLSGIGMKNTTSEFVTIKSYNAIATTLPL